MFIAGLDTGGTNGLVLVNEVGDVVRHLATRNLDHIYAILGQYNISLVILERAPKTQLEYQNAKDELTLYGYKILEVSPGEWKPNPNCKTPKAEHPDWTQHERDALSLIKYYKFAVAKSHTGGKK